LFYEPNTYFAWAEMSSHYLRGEVCLEGKFEKFPPIFGLLPITAQLYLGIVGNIVWMATMKLQLRTTTTTEKALRCKAVTRQA